MKNPGATSIGKASAGSGYLHNQKYDTDRFSDISEGDSQRVNDVDIYDAGYPSGKEEEERVLALDAKIEQITEADQGALQKPQDQENKYLPR